MGVMLGNAERMAMLAAARALEPPPPVDFLTFAETKVEFTARESPVPGPYKRSMFPHWDEVLRALSPDDPCRIVTICGSAQIGKTVNANVFVGGSMVMDPCDLLYTHPTEENARRWSRLKLSPMLRGSAALRAIFPQRSRDGSDSILLKEHRDGLGAILISGANSPASLSQVTMRRQVQDDLSKWETNPAGDPEQQADSRSGAHEFAKILKLGTPLVLPGCRISRSYEKGSQERPYVPCPHCGEMQVLEWENMLANLDPDHPERAHFICVGQGCGAAIEEHHRPQLLAGLEWRAKNAKAKRHHRSFWIWSAYSYLQSWSRIATGWLDAKGDAEKERVFLNDFAGLAYRAASEAPPWEQLRDRAAVSPYRRGTMPPGALAAFLGIDCQIDHVKWQVVAFGREYRRYVIDYGFIPGHITSPSCQLQLDALLRQTWPNAYGHRIGLERAAIDGNAWTEDVWDWAKRHPRSLLIMVRGRHEDHIPRFARVKRERNPRTGKLLKYRSRFYNFAASVLKWSLYRDLAKTDPLERGHVALPAGLEDDYFQELTVERRVPHKRNGDIVYRWEKADTERNEALDTMLQAETAANTWGLRGLPDAIWDKLEKERETPAVPVQGDLEDLMTSAARPPVAEAAPAATPRRRGRRMRGQPIE